MLALVTRPKTMLVALAVVTTVAAAAVSCDDDGGGGGDPLALDEYLGAIERINNDNETRIDEASAGLEELTADTELDELKSVFGGVYGEFADIVADSREELGNLDTPEEAQEAHDDLVAGFEQVEQAFDDAQEAIEEAESREDLAAAVSEIDASEDAAAATARLERGCTALQTLADENNVDVDLRCGTSG